MKRPRQSWADILAEAGATSHGVNLAALTGEPTAKAAVEWAGFPSVFVPPISTNHLFAGKAKRYPSKEYKAWREAAYPVLSKLAKPSLPNELWLVLRGKVNQQRDVANIEKAVTDALVACQIIPQDSVRYIVGNHQIYRPDDGEGRVEVTFTRPLDA